MCGIVGVVSKAYSINNGKIFNQLLIADQLRGTHGTGIFSVDNGEVSVYKKGMNSSDFMQMNKYHQLTKSDPEILIGHNRHATIGSHTDSNSHPFQHGNIVGVHNGTLKNWMSFKSSNGFTDNFINS